MSYLLPSNGADTWPAPTIKSLTNAFTIQLPTALVPNNLKYWELQASKSADGSIFTDWFPVVTIEGAQVVYTHSNLDPIQAKPFYSYRYRLTDTNYRQSDWSARAFAGAISSLGTTDLVNGSLLPDSVGSTELADGSVLPLHITTIGGNNFSFPGFVESKATGFKFPDGTFQTTAASPITDYIPLSTINAKGDVLVGTANDAITRLGVGTNGQALVADSTQASGVKWGTVATGFVDPNTVPAVRVRRSANGTLPAATWTAVGFDVEEYDTFSMHDNVTNNSRMTAPVSGLYLVNATLGWDTTQTAARRLVAIRVNNVDATRSDMTLSSTVGWENTSVVVKLTAGDYVEVFGYSDTAAAVVGGTPGTAQSYTHASMIYMGTGMTVSQGGVPSVRVKRSSTMAITSAVSPNYVAFDLEDHDTDNMHDTVTNNTRITIRTPGIYLLTAHVPWVSSTGGTREIWFEKNRSGIRLDDDVTPAPASVADGVRQTMATQVVLAAGDYVELLAYQNSGSTVNIDFNSGVGLQAVMEATYLGTGTLNSVVWTQDGSGNLQTTTSGYMKFNGTGIFSARMASNQTLVANTPQKVVFGTEEFDPQGWFDPTTGRFQPTVAGYYRVSACLYGVLASAPAGTYLSCRVYKNGAAYKTVGTSVAGKTGQDWMMPSGTALVFLNGSTDYAEIYSNSDQALVLTTSATDYNHFEGHYVGS